MKQTKKTESLYAWLGRMLDQVDLDSETCFEDIPEGVKPTHQVNDYEWKLAIIISDLLYQRGEAVQKLKVRRLLAEQFKVEDQQGVFSKAELELDSVDRKYQYVKKSLKIEFSERFKLRNSDNFKLYSNRNVIITPRNTAQEAQRQLVRFMFEKIQKLGYEHPIGLMLFQDVPKTSIKIKTDGNVIATTASKVTVIRPEKQEEDPETEVQE